MLLDVFWNSAKCTRKEQPMKGMNPQEGLIFLMPTWYVTTENLGPWMQIQLQRLTRCFHAESSPQGPDVDNSVTSTPGGVSLLFVSMVHNSSWPVTAVCFPFFTFWMDNIVSHWFISLTCALCIDAWWQTTSVGRMDRAAKTSAGWS